YPDHLTAPGGEIARLCAVRALDASDQSSFTFDIRRPVQLQLEYEVRKPGHIITPSFRVTNHEGIDVFSLFDWSPDWRECPRQCGRYISTVTIPGNFLAEGMHFVSVGLFARRPYFLQFYERDVIAFCVVDSFDGDAARGELGGPIFGVVRPILPWR